MSRDSVWQSEQNEQDGQANLSELPRELGWYGGHEPGPLVVCIGGIHGNEPAGVFAAQRVLHLLHQKQPPFHGILVALAGNRTALAKGCRYLEHDLNRLWTSEQVASLQQQPRPPRSEFASPEHREQQELFDTIETLLAGRKRANVFLDLHTTSAPGVPFSVIGDTLLNRRLALNLPAPVILGLEEHLDGTILNYINDLGHLAVGFEGGQNQDPLAIDHHEVAIWTTLMSVGCVRAHDLSHFDLLREKLDHATAHVPRALEIRFHHAVCEADAFVMQPGYTNFQAVKRGQVLAHDRRGAVRAQTTGRILMPLYQSQGSDGFFLVREVRPMWLSVSKWMRALQLEKALPWLPGIRRHPQRADMLLVNPHVARWFVLEIFHLLGFRRQRPEGEHLVVSRRRHAGATFEAGT